MRAILVVARAAYYVIGLAYSTGNISNEMNNQY